MVAVDQGSAPVCLEAVRQAGVDRSLQIIALEVTPEGWLHVVVQGATQPWDLEIDCNGTSITRLPDVRLKPTGNLHPHVSYYGTVCVSDNQGLSLDPDRKPAVVAHTFLATFDLLEKWAVNKSSSDIEFLNELEGYWGGLPGVIGTYGAFEVDGKDRLLTSFLREQKDTRRWFFTERNAKPHPKFEVQGAAHQVALYVHMSEIALPPTPPDAPGPAYVVRIRDAMSPAQKELWHKLVKPSAGRNHPRRVVLLVSVPRSSGGVSVVGFEFGTRNGDVDLAARVRPVTMRRFTAGYMRERGGASPLLATKHIVVIGCGAVGAAVADNLAAAGVGTLTLVDNDVYTEDNVFRHVLDPVYIDFAKVRGLRRQLESRYPGLTVTPHASSGQKWLEGADLQGIDGIIFALGLPTLDRWFARELRKQKTLMPLVFSWLEPLDLGGHSVLTWTQGEGCLDCLYRDDENVSSLKSRIAFLAPDQAVSKNLTGCASVFVPYGALQSRRTALIAAEQMLTAISNHVASSYQFWTGEGVAAAAEGLRTTPWWNEARTTLPSAKQSQRAFGRPCPTCKATL